MNHSHDLLYRIALQKIPKVGSVIARNLVSHCGGVEAIFREKRGHLLKIPGVGETLVQNIQNKEVLRDAERELKHVVSHGLTVHFYLDETFPRRLTPHNQSPVLLYSKGSMDLNPTRVVAIVGTRQPSTYGVKCCEQIVKDLAPYQPTIISGLAYGIDIIAHRAAMNYHLPTIGVLGSGFGRIYPQAHLKQAKRMMRSGGLLTEFEFETGPDRENFPTRNRIVAGMTDALVVVESPKKGGSMISVEFANAFNKDVMAVPGRVEDPLSAGCNALIREHKAHLITGGRDVAALLGWDHTPGKSVVQREIFPELSDSEQLIMELLGKHNVREIDALAAKSKFTMSELATVLLSLEFKGIVKSLPGKRYHIM